MHGLARVYGGRFVRYMGAWGLEVLLGTVRTYGYYLRAFVTLFFIAQNTCKEKRRDKFEQLVVRHRSIRGRHNGSVVILWLAVAVDMRHLASTRESSDPWLAWLATCLSLQSYEHSQLLGGYALLL
jgi:hypothetical protein